MNEVTIENSPYSEWRGHEEVSVGKLKPAPPPLQSENKKDKLELKPAWFEGFKRFSFYRSGRGAGKVSMMETGGSEEWGGGAGGEL